MIEPRALDELIPDWAERGAALDTPATDDRMLYLTRRKAIRVPLLDTVMPHMGNHPNFIVSLGDVCRWLAGQAEALGVEIYLGFGAAELLEEDGRIVGVATGDIGVTRSGEPGPGYAPGMELRAAYTLFSEGCCGSLSKRLMERFGLRAGVDPQTYGLGVKELWEVPAAQHRPGPVQHMFGWPLDHRTYGGSWMYQFGENLVSYGFVVGLDYPNTWLSPFEEMQRLKTHPAIRPHLEGGRRISYGARALSEGGLQSIPRLIFPGGALIGDSAGFLNDAKIKGTNAAMKSGMLAAEAVAEALADGRPSSRSPSPPRCAGAGCGRSCARCATSARRSPGSAASPARSIRGIDAMVLRGRAPWTLRHRHPDHAVLDSAAASAPIAYPKPDGVLTFDRSSSVYLSNTSHEEDQPVHLRLREPGRWRSVNWDVYRSPESRYCPAGVYEVVGADEVSGPRLQINTQNRVYCKTCDIKDPTENIDWSAPEGGGGPNYIGGM